MKVCFECEVLDLSLSMRQNEMLRMANQVRLRSFRTATKYMYGVEIPKDHRDAVRHDEINGNDHGHAYHLGISIT
jgi:hypothetical protein